MAGIKRSVQIALLSTAWALTSAAGHAETHSEADYSRSSMMKQVRALDRADRALRVWLKAHGETIEMDRDQIQSVEAVLKGWRVYTELECGLVGSATGGNGTDKAAYEFMCKERRYADRVRSVARVTRCLKGLSTKQGDDRYAWNCLGPLTPLKTTSDFQA